MRPKQRRLRPATAYCWNCQGLDPDRMMTIAEVADYCQVSVKAVYRWMDLELIEWVLTPGGSRRIYRDSLLRHPEEASDE